MKQYCMILIIALALVILAGCAPQPAAEPTVPPTEPQPQPHTIAPPDAAQEPEWAAVDCEIRLESADDVYAEGDDFICFALIGNTDEDCELRFQLDEVTAAMLAEQPSDTAYYLIVNGERIGSAAVGDDGSLVTVGDRMSYRELKALATEIRGLAE